MSSFSEYMNGMKAEKELKEKTEAFVRSALSNAECQGDTADSGLEFRKDRFAVKKLLVAAASAAACVLLALGGNAYYHMPVNYVCLDINPSVELGINAFGRVVSAQAYNEDGLQLLGDNKYSNLSVKDAVSTLVQDAAEQGFIAENGSTVIAVTAEAGSNKAAAGLQNSSETEVNSALSTGRISAIVYSDCSDLQLRKQAKEAEISPGKLRLILILQTLDPNITIEEYKNAKLTDIINKANELLSQPDNSSWQNGNYAETLERIRNAAEQVQAAYANAERERNRNGDQNHNPGPSEQEQDQNQKFNDNGAQNQVQDQGAGTRQQIQNQSSDTGQQQTQNQEEPMQNQNQGNSTSVSDQNQGQATGAQSGKEITAQDNGSGAQTASGSAEAGMTENDSGSASGLQSGSGKGGR